MIKLTVEGLVYEFDQERLLLAEARELKTFTGLTPPRWAAGIDEQDPDSVQGLIYLAKKRAGETLRWSDLDQLDFADIELELMGEDADAPDGTETAGQETAPSPDPTVPPPDSGTIPTDGSTATSPPSPTTSSTPPPTSAL
ncbi:hypothetical protein [Streptomyces sp. NBC_00996]|uniref:hypothetical protein n=1 Tax=Streptomyces sp. NBC_00996 TaxID=2903710 RepID=UPI00386F7B38|nr:hypothetical protein OG390_17205 [Streptomyces sp. NBC_00996]